MKIISGYCVAFAIFSIFISVDLHLSTATSTPVSQTITHTVRTFSISITNLWAFCVQNLPVVDSWQFENKSQKTVHFAQIVANLDNLSIFGRLKTILTFGVFSGRFLLSVFFNSHRLKRSVNKTNGYGMFALFKPSPIALVKMNLRYDALIHYKHTLAKRCTDC